MALLDFIDRLSPIQRLGLNTIEGAVKSGLGVNAVKRVFRAAGFSMGNERIGAAVQYYQQANRQNQRINQRSVNYKPLRKDIPTWWGTQDQKYRYVVGIDGFDGPQGRGYLRIITVDSNRVLSQAEALEDALIIMQRYIPDGDEISNEMELIDQWKRKN